MEIPVVKRTGKKSFEIVFLNVEDVLYTYIHASVLRYRTVDAVYDQVTTLDEQEVLLTHYGFVRTERGFLADLDKATYYDSELKVVSFKEDPDDLSLSVPVSQPRITFLKERLRKLRKRPTGKPRFIFA